MCFIQFSQFKELGMSKSPRTSEIQREPGSIPKPKEHEYLLSFFMMVLLALFLVLLSVNAESLRGNLEIGENFEEAHAIRTCTWHPVPCENDDDCIGVGYKDLAGHPCDSEDDCIPCSNCEHTYYGPMCYPPEPYNTVDSPKTPVNVTST